VSAAIRALTILSGSFTGSPRLILSTFSVPPQAVKRTEVTAYSGICSPRDERRSYMAQTS